MGKSPNSSLSDRHLIAIAKVITNWSAFERILRLIALGLTTNAPVSEAEDAIAAIAYEGMQTRTLIGLIQTLTSLRRPDDFEIVKQFCKRALVVKRERDIYAHAMFHRGSKPESIRPLLVKTVPRLRSISTDLTADEIEKWSKEAANLMLSGLALLTHWGYLIPPDDSSPDTLDEPNLASPPASPRQAHRQKRSPAPKHRKPQRQQRPSRASRRRAALAKRDEKPS